ncbi:MAG: MBL fold metallo-hydrolase [Nitratireductor sp.]|nr:MBL fold metallo-hydrolase [Nitratireductor sp.]
MPDRKNCLRFTLLGCSSSPGVPRINGDWGACDPDNPKNRRTRCSLLVERFGPAGVTRIVIDTSPDFRFQMLAAGADSLDAAVYTHAHADHIHGIDDLRQYAIIRRARIPVYSDRATYRELEEKFGYVFRSAEGSIYPPICDWHEIAPARPFVISGQGGSIELLPLLQIHGPIPSLGFRFGWSGDPSAPTGGFAYCPDVSDFPVETLKLLQGLDALVIDALQYREHISHLSLAQALDWIGRLAPRRAILTHMHIPLDYETVQRETPAHVEPAHDGMVIELALAG